MLKCDNSSNAAVKLVIATTEEATRARLFFFWLRARGVMPNPLSAKFWSFASLIALVKGGTSQIETIFFAAKKNFSGDPIFRRKKNGRKTFDKKKEK